jgi:hypothetical protein
VSQTPLRLVVTDKHGGDSGTGARVTAEDARRVVANAARRYFESRRAHVDEFIDRHFSLVRTLLPQSTPSWRRGSRYRANRALAQIKKLFAWSLDRGYIDVHPIVGLKPPAKEVSRDRILTDAELRGLLIEGRAAAVRLCCCRCAHHKGSSDMCGDRADFRSDREYDCQGAPASLRAESRGNRAD